MICVYPADCTDFSTNGNGTLAPLSAEVTETLNGEYELTLVHPIDEAGKWQRLVEGCILRAPVPAAMTPRVNFTAPGDDNRTEVWRVNTDFSGAETRKGTLRLRSGPGTKYKVLATYKNGSFVQVIAKTNSSWYEVTAPDGKHGYMSTTYLVLDHTEGSASEATSSVVESRQLRDQPFRIYRVVPELDKITVYARHVFPLRWGLLSCRRFLPPACQSTTSPSIPTWTARPRMWSSKTAIPWMLCWVKAVWSKSTPEN